MKNIFYIIPNDEIDKDKIYLVTLASKEELKTGNYIDLGEMKISSNPKKFGVIKNIGENNDK